MTAIDKDKVETAKEPEPRVEAAPAKAKPSPVATTETMPVFRTDLGESLPAQKPAGVV